MLRLPAPFLFPLFDTWIGRLRVMRGDCSHSASTNTVDLAIMRSCAEEPSF